jgi:hypothetical protein
MELAKVTSEVRLIAESPSCTGSSVIVKPGHYIIIPYRWIEALIECLHTRVLMTGLPLLHCLPSLWQRGQPHYQQPAKRPKKAPVTGVFTACQPRSWFD